MYWPHQKFVSWRIFKVSHWLSEDISCGYVCCLFVKVQIYAKLGDTHETFGSWDLHDSKKSLTMYAKMNDAHSVNAWTIAELVYAWDFFNENSPRDKQMRQNCIFSLQSMFLLSFHIPRLLRKALLHYLSILHLDTNTDSDGISMGRYMMVIKRAFLLSRDTEPLNFPPQK